MLAVVISLCYLDMVDFLVMIELTRWPKQIDSWGWGYPDEMSAALVLHLGVFQRI